MALFIMFAWFYVLKHVLKFLNVLVLKFFYRPQAYVVHI